MKLFSVGLLVFTFIFSIFNVNAEIKKDCIVIDAGHGGMDGGTSRDGILESDMALEITYKVREIFELNGYDVILTRTDKDDLCEGKFIKREDMDKRVAIINQSSAKIAISIHLNNFNLKNYKGAQVFYSNANNENKDLAVHIQDSLKGYLKNTNRTATYRDNIYLLNKVNIPMCLIECGFISNDYEFSLLKTEAYQYKLAYAIFYGVANYV